MNDTDSLPVSHPDTYTYPEQRSYSGLFLILLALGLTGAVVSLAWSYTLSSRLSRAEARLAEATTQNEKLAAELTQTNARLKVASDELGQSLGMTQRQLEAKAEGLMRRQQQEARRLEAEQAESRRQIGAVTTDVSTVKTDVGGVKTAVAQTRDELKSAESQLQSMKGDLGVQSGLIATNHSELELLKHRGDRNYIEFTLGKGHRQAISTVGLELRKADVKHSRYTLVVYADDKKIEKKDRGLNEPVQFYTGKEGSLYELVVNSIDKNQVRGYLSTPKNAPQPVTVSGQ